VRGGADGAFRNYALRRSTSIDGLCGPENGRGLRFWTRSFLQAAVSEKMMEALVGSRDLGGGFLLAAVDDFAGALKPQFDTSRMFLC
jgi:hypothetical protein